VVIRESDPQTLLFFNTTLSAKPEMIVDTLATFRE
jgi:hypothetical protein